jgi:hypothetical protein
MIPSRNPLRSPAFAASLAATTLILVQPMTKLGIVIIPVIGLSILITLAAVFLWSEDIAYRGRPLTIRDTVDAITGTTLPESAAFWIGSACSFGVFAWLRSFDAIGVAFAIIAIVFFISAVRCWIRLPRSR